MYVVSDLYEFPSRVPILLVMRITIQLTILHNPIHNTCKYNPPKRKLGNGMKKSQYMYRSRITMSLFFWGGGIFRIDLSCKLIFEASKMKQRNKKKNHK